MKNHFEVFLDTIVYLLLPVVNNSATNVEKPEQPQQKKQHIKKKACMQSRSKSSGEPVCPSRLKDRRKGLGLTLQGLSKIVGVSYSSISRAENSIGSVSATRRIMQALDGLEAKK